LYFVDTRAEDESETTWFRDGGPLIRLVEVDFMM
jgi:hypothetical protein